MLIYDNGTYSKTIILLALVICWLTEFSFLSYYFFVLIYYIILLNRLIFSKFVL